MKILSANPKLAPRIRVCHVQVFPMMTGVQRSMLEIFKQLDPARYEIHVACREAGPLTEELERQGIRWHAIPALDRPISLVGDWRAYRQLYRLFREQRFDIVHTHSSKPGFLGRLAARQAGVPCVIHHVRAFAFHEFSPTWKYEMFSRCERWAGGYCDRVLFVNEEERELSVSKGWLPAEKCLTIYNGVDLQMVDPARREPTRERCRAAWNLSEDEVAILFAGRLEPQKQPLLLPAIAAQLRECHTERRWRLIVAGAGPDEAQLRAHVARHSLGDRVSLVGWQAEPFAALAGADVVLLPSLFEGLPRVLIEAQAAGLPVVASDVTGNREVVTPETGFLCSPQSPRDYASKLALLVDEPLRRERLGHAARQRAEQHFDTVANHRRIAALYDELLGLAPLAALARRAA